MDILRIEESNRYGYLIQCGDFEKFFDDSISGGKEKSLRAVKHYLTMAPKLYPNREVFKSQEFIDYCERLKNELHVEFAQFNEFKISSIVNRLKIKNGVKTSFWELTVIDQNNRSHVFDYNMNEFKTKESVVEAFNNKYNLNLTYVE